MTDFDDTPLDPEEERRAAVAEYVLGLGTADERAAMARAIETDAALAAEAVFWEKHFARFNQEFASVAPPESMLARIEARLFPDLAPKGKWYDSLVFWRGLAGLAVAGALMAIGLNVLAPFTGQPQETVQLIAALQPVESDVGFVARYRSDTGELRISGTGSPAAAGSDYELWFIEGEDAPVSMGVIAVGETLSVAVDESLRERLTEGITLAVTLEVAGGSPTGQAQGPLVSAGPVAAI